MTLQNAPPGLDYDRDKRFSKVVLALSVSACAVNVSDCSFLTLSLCSRLLVSVIEFEHCVRLLLLLF